MFAAKYKNRAIFSVILILLAFAQSTCRSPETTVEIKVPVILQDARGIKSIHLELSYDPYLLKVLEVERGELAADSILAYGGEVQGGLKIGLVSDGKIDGSGTLAIITFAAAPIEEVPANMQLSNVQVYSAEGNGLEEVQLIDGSFSYADRSLTAPSITCLPKTQAEQE